MSIAGYKAVLNRSGTPTAFTDEAASTDGSTVFGNRWQINDAVKEVWARSVVPTFKESSTAPVISSTDIVKINYLFGRVTFGSTHPTIIVATGTYLPMFKAVGANAYTLNQVSDILDDTEFNSSGWRNKNLGLQDVNLSITAFEIIGSTIGSTDPSVFKNWEDRTAVVAEIQPGGGSNPKARGYFITESIPRSGDVAALESVDISLQLDGDPQADFGWSDQ